MADVLIRNLSEETHRALKQRAARSGRSVSAEIRTMLEGAATAEKRVELGNEIHEFAMRYGGFELVVERDKTPAGYVDFSGPEFDPPESDL